MPIASDPAQSDGDVLRRLADLERELRELAAGRGLEAATIGAGGIRVRGGEIRIQNPAGTEDLAVLSSNGISFGGVPLLLPGSISMYAGAGAIPAGWLACNGQAVSRTTYAQLFAVIGTTWGAGNGSTTFNVPDLRDRTLVGAGSSYAVGATGGGATHAHTNPSTSSTGSHTHSSSGTDSAGSHTHSIPGGSDSTFGATNGAIFVSDQSHTHGGTNSGGSHSHSVSGSTGANSDHSHTQGDTGSGSSLPPYAAVVPIIRY